MSSNVHKESIAYIAKLKGEESKRGTKARTNGAKSEPGKASMATGPPLETAELLDEIRTFIRRFVVLPTPLEDHDVVGDLLAVWTLHTHAFEASWATPYLRITSATPDSGKTLLLEVLASICRLGWHAVNPSVAVLYRKVDRDQPTLLLDEMDNYPMEDRRDALAVLNPGYKKGAMVPRCSERGDLQEFRVYSPKAYAGLDQRAIPAALLSRSITIRMETKLRSEPVEMWAAPLVEPEAGDLRERCQVWAEHHVEALAGRPDLLDLTNRRAEVWWALLAIGEHAGGGWQLGIQRAAKTLSAGGDETDQMSDQVQMLVDVRDAFGGERAIFTKDLLDHLNGLDESPWGARRKGEGLDARGLASLLRPFRIRSKTVRDGDETAKGYHLDQFEQTFARHLPEGSQASQGSQPAPHLEPDVTDVTDVTDIQTPSEAAA
ncbi:MAG: DUF3631 domain-containing protein [Solirubrobacterales bacterium]